MGEAETPHAETPHADAAGGKLFRAFMALIIASRIEAALGGL
jgi:hypothetical protein